jgi:hypothetical protein
LRSGLRWEPAWQPRALEEGWANADRVLHFAQYDEGYGDRHYGHCVVAGIDQYPLKITKGMEKKKLDKRSKLKPFLKVVNYNHVMPTRYADFSRPAQASFRWVLVQLEPGSCRTSTPRRGARPAAGLSALLGLLYAHAAGSLAYAFSPLCVFVPAGIA